MNKIYQNDLNFIKENFTSSELMNINLIIKNFNINFPATKKECWNIKTCGNITKGVLNYIKEKDLNLLSSIEYATSLWDIPCSEVIRRQDGLDESCMNGARCNLCGFRVLRRLENIDNENDNLWESGCLIYALFYSMIKKAREESGNRMNNLIDDEIIANLEAWWNMTKKFYGFNIWFRK